MWHSAEATTRMMPSAAGDGGGAGPKGSLTSRPPQVSVKRHRLAVTKLAAYFAAFAAVSSAANSIHTRDTAIMGLLNAANFAKNITSLARAAREAARARIGCKCKHRGICKYKCRCSNNCKCKYWRNRLLPSYEWLRKALSGITEDEALEAFRESTRENLRALHRARMLRGGRLQAVALDKHAIKRAARAIGLLFGLFNGHVGWHEVYMTAHVVIGGERLTIAAVPFKLGMGNHKAVRILLEEIRAYAPGVRFVIGDKEFCNTQVINEVKAAKMKFLDAHPHSKKTDQLIQKLEESKKRRIAVRSVMKSKGSKETAEYWLIGTLSRKAKDGKWKPEDGLREKYVFYAASDPRMNVSHYAKRWGIETAYRMDESIRAKTASRSRGVRTFFFLFTIAVYNMQVVLNAVHTGPGAYRYQTLQTVVTLLCDEVRIMLAEQDAQDAPDPGGGGGPAAAAAVPAAACGQR